MDDRYIQGQGMFGGIKGTYGRYSVGPRVSNLAAQFNDYMTTVEDSKRRRFKRKRESGYTGAGFWFGQYPNMIGAMGSGAVTSGNPQQPHDLNDSGQTASAADAAGLGGTAFNGGGAVS